MDNYLKRIFANKFVGIQDRFGESGDPYELIDVFGLGVDSIKSAVKKAVSRKRNL